MDVAITIMVIIFVVLVYIIFFLFLAYYAIVTCMESKETKTMYLKIMVNYIQTMMLISTMNIQFPSYLEFGYIPTFGSLSAILQCIFDKNE